MIRTKFVAYLTVTFAVFSAHAGAYDDFFRAVATDDSATIRTLVARGVDPNSTDPDGQPAIIRALREDANQAALTLAGLPGSNVNVLNRHGETPLMIAAIKGQIEVCKALIERGAAINRPGWAPLHYAASSESLTVVRLLLQQGAVVDARAPNGRTPLMQAALYGSEEVVAALVAAGADRQLRDERGASAAELARNAGRHYLFERLEPRAGR